jgi:nucleotide-binding universal stress UspA family protein
MELPDIQKILYATDLSESAKNAIRYAILLARRFHASVAILHVIPDVFEEMSESVGVNLFDFFGEDKWKDLQQEGYRAAQEAIQERIGETYRTFERDATECRLQNADILINIGNPIEEVTAAANSGKYDLLVMGTHGHGKLADLMIGSVARSVIRKSSIPVLTVRLPQLNSIEQENIS